MTTIEPLRVGAPVTELWAVVATNAHGREALAVHVTENGERLLLVTAREYIVPAFRDMIPPQHDDANVRYRLVRFTATEDKL